MGGVDGVEGQATVLPGTVPGVGEIVSEWGYSAA